MSPLTPPPSPSRRSLDAEHPLTASWPDAMHPHGHFTRASARWIDAFVEKRLRAGDSPAMVGAIAVASLGTRFAHGAPIFERACSLDPAGADCLRGGAAAERAFGEADAVFSHAARHWTPPAVRGWSRSIHESDIKLSASRFFGRMVEASMEGARGDAFHGLASKAGLLGEPDPRDGRPRAESVAAATGRVKAIKAAIDAGVAMPAFWAQRRDRVSSLRRALTSLNPSACDDLARALFETPQERGAAWGESFLGCAEILERDFKPSMAEAYAAIRDPNRQRSRDEFNRGRAHSLAGALTHVLSRCPKPSFGIDERSLWNALLPMDWASPERDRSAMEVLRTVELWPPKFVEAVRLMGEAAERLGLCPSGSAPEAGAKAWRHLAAARADARFPAVFLSLAKSYPDAARQEEALKICSAPMRAKIEAQLIADAAGVHQAPSTGMGRPRI